MKLKFIFIVYLYLILIPMIKCSKINILNNNQGVVIGLNFSDGIFNNSFSLYINGSFCYQSDQFDVTMTNNQKYNMVINTIVPTNSCLKATLLSSTIIPDNLQMNFTMTLAPSSMYTLFIVINGVISKQQSFQSLDGKSSSVVACNVTSDFGSNRLQVVWSPPSSANGQILVYNVWIQDIYGTCISQWKSTCSNCDNMIAGVQDSSNIQCPTNYNVSFKNTDQTFSVQSNNSQISPFTNYKVSVVAINGYGWGDIKVVSFRSDPYNPNVVTNFKCGTLTSNALICSWQAPDKINDISVNYIVRCRGGSINNTVVVNSLYVIVSNNVVPDVNYTCTIMACNSVGCSTTSQTSLSIGPTFSAVWSSDVDPRTVEMIMLTTPNSPTSSQITITLPYTTFIYNISSVKNMSIVVCIFGKFLIYNSPNQAEKTYADCDKGNKCPYVIHLPPFNILGPYILKNVFNEEFTIGDGSTCGNSCNGPLASSSTYLIGFRLCTTDSCAAVTIINRTSLNIIPIVASVTVILVVIIICVTVVVICKRHPGRIPKPEPTVTTISVEEVTSPPEYSLLPPINTVCPIDLFSPYYQSLIQNANMKATEQFMKLTDIERVLQSDQNLILVDGDEMQNRYIHIRPYKHNIIRLEGQDDYINASRICLDHCCLESRRACNCMNYYIATQGPIGNDMEGKTQTMGDFWKMVLQYNVSTIINLTKCAENGKDNCAQYWPVIGNEAFVSGESIVNVEFQKNVMKSTYDETTFLVSMSDRHKSVTQFHYTGWDEHCNPRIEDFFEFYEQYKRLKKMDQPVLVHCSDGVGRTGTFILIDIMINKINNGERIVDIYNTLLKLRQCRVSMVQNEKQYVFVHEIINQYLQRPDRPRVRDQYTYNNAYQNTGYE